jgi:peptidoglycan/xylan/chitin deacetylase (PgdA/CDA1 family)
MLKKMLKNSFPRNVLVCRLNPKASDSILLTFDDGPDKEITPRILERLQFYKIRAVFFIVGRFAVQNPHILEKIHENGHLVGNHTFTHPNDRLPNFFAFRADVKKCQTIIKSIIGCEPTLFRPPRGIISPKTVLAAKSLNLKSIFWSNEGGEWGKRIGEDAHAIGKILIDTLTPRDILLLHDNNNKVPEILDIVLPILKIKNIDLQNATNYLK